MSGQFHFFADHYLDLMRSEVPVYDELQDVIAQASGRDRSRVLDLGTGTGQTAARVLGRHEGATVIGIDQRAEMLEHAATLVPGADLRVGRLEDPLPDGPFDLVVTALAVHHLDDSAKADLFTRVHGVLEPGGRFVLGDVVVPDDPADAVTPLVDGYDRPSPLADQLAWLADAGLAPEVVWRHHDLVVVTADR